MTATDTATQTATQTATKTLVRLVVAGVVLAVLGGLLGWQVHRERLVRACVENGGLWHGARSECIRPMLQRDYRRS